MSTKTAEVFSSISNDSGHSAWMAGFFLLGVLLGMLGSLVVTWHYHLDAEPKSIGYHFLGLSAGFIVASQSVPLLLRKVPLRTIALASSGLAFLALVGLSILAPPSAPVWRMAMLTLAGMAAGGLTYSLFHANESLFEKSPAVAANKAGALFVGGSLLATIVVALTYFSGSIRVQTALLSLVPAAYVAVMARNRFQLGLQPAQPHGEDILRDTLKDLRSIATLLFSLLIFFQFACEWAITGWLPLFLIHTLGINPVNAIWSLALYFLALMVGRLLAQMLMPAVSHKRLLLISVALAMVGYLLLALTSFGLLAMVAAVMIGLGHAPIYPLVAERLDHRLSYHAGFYSGTITIAMAAALATPWLLGYVAESFGMPAVMFFPAIASIAVLVLAILIMLEARLMGNHQLDGEDGR